VSNLKAFRKKHTLDSTRADLRAHNTMGHDDADDEQDDPNVCDCGAFKTASEDFCEECLAEAAHQAKCDRQQRPY